MNRPPPLTREQLLAIQAGHKRNQDLRALLWEIRRLRIIVLKTQQLLDCLDEHAQHTYMIRDSLRELLRDEPCVLEMNEIRRDLLRKDT